MRRLIPFVVVLAGCFGDGDPDSDWWGPTPDAAPATSAQRDHGTVTLVTDTGTVTETVDVRVLRQYTNDLDNPEDVFTAWVVEGTKPFRCEGGTGCIRVSVPVPVHSGLGVHVCDLGTRANISAAGVYLDTDGRLLTECSYEVVDDDTGPYVSIQNLALTWNGQTIRADLTGKR